jgi:hypothetical protein
MQDQQQQQLLQPEMWQKLVKPVQQLHSTQLQPQHQFDRADISYGRTMYHHHQQQQGQLQNMWQPLLQSSQSQRVDHIGMLRGVSGEHSLQQNENKNLLLPFSKSRNSSSLLGKRSASAANHSLDFYSAIVPPAPISGMHARIGHHQANEAALQVPAYPARGMKHPSHQHQYHSLPMQCALPTAALQSASSSFLRLKQSLVLTEASSQVPSREDQNQFNSYQEKCQNQSAQDTTDFTPVPMSTTTNLLNPTSAQRSNYSSNFSLDYARASELLATCPRETFTDATNIDYNKNSPLPRTDESELAAFDDPNHSSFWLHQSEEYKV